MLSVEHENRYLVSPKYICDIIDITSSPLKYIIPIEYARTKRGSSHIGCKMNKMAKTLCPCALYFTHSMLCLPCMSLICFEHSFTVYYETYTDGRNWSPVAETHTL